jgi:hypothetical protein
MSRLCVIRWLIPFSMSFVLLNELPHGDFFTNRDLLMVRSQKEQPFPRVGLH